LKDPAHDPGPEQRHTGEIVTFVPWSMFGEWRNTDWKKRPDEYDRLKERVMQKLLHQFFRHMPELEPMLDYAELSTPISTRHFVRPVMGSIYGLEPTPRRFRTAWLRPRAPIEDLFFSGSEVTTVGVMGAMMGGVLAAASAEPVGTFNVMKEVAPKKR
jgi:all-trans-retinol 13,14-reductase